MEIVGYMLTDACANVLGAANGAEALKAFTDSNPGAIDAILTDMTMPKPLNPAQFVATIAGQCRRHK